MSDAPSPANPPSPNYAIARIDLPVQGTHGWQVRLQRRGVKYAKFFGDRTHSPQDGDPAAALQAARCYRDQLLANLQHQDISRVCARSPRNSSGVVGVSRVSVVASNGTAYHFWQAAWTISTGQRKCVKFSVRRYGDKAAFDLAVQARIDATSPSTLP